MYIGVVFTYYSMIRKTNFGAILKEAHFEKAYYNISFVSFLISSKKFHDWQVVGLYFALYHGSLALVAHKGFSSKDHNETLQFITQKYSELNKEEIEFINVLCLNKQDIEFYTRLKQERQKASYVTNTNFVEQDIFQMQKKAIQLLNKMKKITE